MAASNTVTLEFVADTRAFDRGIRDVSAQSKAVEKDLDAVAASTYKMTQQHQAAAKGVRELSVAALTLSSELPPMAKSFALNTLVVGDLAGAYVRIKPAIAGVIAKTKEMSAASLLLRGGIAAAAAATAGWALSMEGSLTKASTYTRGLKDLNYAVATDIDLVGRHIPLLSKLTGWYRSNADAASQAAHASYDYANALKAAADAAAANGLGVGGYPDDPDGMAYSAAVLSGTAGVSDAFFAQLQDNADKAEQLARASSTRIASSAASGVSKAIEAAKQKAQQKLADWQQIVDKYEQVGRDIAGALAPKLEAGQGSSLLIHKGDTLIDNLRKQLADTKRLAADIKKLTSSGLSGDLIAQLVAGGLSSLPAADELLAGGKSRISEANKLAKGINKSANGIAAAEAARQFGSAPKVTTIHFDFGKSTNDFKTIFRKALKTDKSFANDVKLAVK